MHNFIATSHSRKQISHLVLTWDYTRVPTDLQSGPTREQGTHQFLQGLHGHLLNHLPLLGVRQFPLVEQVAQVVLHAGVGPLQREVHVDLRQLFGPLQAVRVHLLEQVQEDLGHHLQRVFGLVVVHGGGLDAEEAALLEGQVVAANVRDETG